MHVVLVRGRYGVLRLACIGLGFRGTFRFSGLALSVGGGSGPELVRSTSSPDQQCLPRVYLLNTASIRSLDADFRRKKARLFAGALQIEFGICKFRKTLPR